MITRVVNAPELTNGSIILNGFTTDDVEAHVAGEDEEQARRFGWYPARSTAATARAAFESWRADWATGGAIRTFAVREARTRALAGGCQLRLGEKRIAEVSYWTFPDYRGRGFATAAVRLACAFAFSELEIDRVEAFIEPDNTGSRRVVEAAGFVEEGVVRERDLTAQGERRDMVIYGLLQRDLK